MFSRYFYGGSEAFQEMILVLFFCFIGFFVYGYGQHVFFEYTPSWQEYIAVVTGFACVWLTRTENVWCWPLGIISTILLGFYFLKISLFGQAGLQLIYFTPIQFWGWHVWVNGGEARTNIKISTLGAKEWVGLFIAYVIGFLILRGVIESQFASPQMVAWDVSVVVASVIAQILLSYKKIESWYWWFLPVNVSAIGLYYVVDSPMTVILYVAYLLNCGYAIYEWRKEFAKQQQN